MGRSLEFKRNAGRNNSFWSNREKKSLDSSNSFWSNREKKSLDSSNFSCSNREKKSLDSSNFSCSNRTSSLTPSQTSLEPETSTRFSLRFPEIMDINMDMESRDASWILDKLNMTRRRTL